MILDIVLIAFLGFLSYCLYIVIIIPYQKAVLEEKIELSRYISSITGPKKPL